MTDDKPTDNVVSFQQAKLDREPIEFTICFMQTGQGLHFNVHGLGSEHTDATKLSLAHMLEAAAGLLRRSVNNDSDA